MRLRPAFASLLLLAQFASAEPAPPRVLARYREMLAANPVEGTALDRLWQDFQERGKTGDLLAEYGAEKTFAGRLIFGHLLRRAGQPAEAQAAYEEAARLDPASPLPPLALGHLRSETGHSREAAAALAEAVRLLGSDPRAAGALQDLGNAWLAAGEPERATEAWEKIVALDPQNLSLRRELAEQYARHHLTGPARAHLQYLTQHAPASERAQAWQLLANLEQSTGHSAAALHALEEGLALTAHNNWLHGELESQLIRLYQRLGRIHELEARWRQAAAESPRDAGAALQLVDLYHRLGDSAGERSALEKLTALLPKNTEYQLRLARLSAREEALPAAIAIYDRLLAEQPAQADWVFERAEIEIRQEHPEAAEARIEAWLQPLHGDETARARALEWYGRHRLWVPMEKLLTQATANGADDAVLALANFLFERHRDAEGEEQLRRLIHPADSPATRAAAGLRVGKVLRQQNLLEPARRAVSQAADSAKGTPHLRRDALLTLGEICAVLGQAPAARAAVEEAGRLSENAAEILEADQRLFDLLRQSAAEHAAAHPTTDPGAIDSPPPDPAMVETEGDLRRAAARAATAEAWLRLARWQMWARENTPAEASIGRALELDPKSVAAHELAVTLASSEPGTPGIAWHLERLIELDPKQAAVQRRRLAELALSSGRAADAVQELTELVRDQPGDLDLLADLANAQQAMEDWPGALETWKRALGASPPTRHRDAIAPLLRLYERTAQPIPAAKLLLAETIHPAQAKEQRELFGELLSHCRQHNLLPWLRTHWEAYRAGADESFFNELAEADILEATGARSEAFAVLEQAFFITPEPIEVLPELVRKAEALHRIDAAIDWQEKLVRMVPPGLPEPWERLAQLQEKAYALPAATGTWREVARRFPRDSEALLHASEFAERLCEPAWAADLLRRATALEGAGPAALLHLGQLDLETGQAASARGWFEKVLATTAPPAPDEPPVFPAAKPEHPGRVQEDYLKAVRSRHGKPSSETLQALRGFWLEPPGSAHAERDRRLEAIRMLADLARRDEDPAVLPRWIERWKQLAASDPLEAMWALYHAGASGPALDLAERIGEATGGRHPDPQGFLWMALQSGEFARLGQWLHSFERTVAERDFFRAALNQYLAARGPAIEPALIQGLFPPSTTGGLWEMAQTCAARGDFTQALRLGQRSLSTGRSERPDRLCLLAEWSFGLGDAESVRATLLEAAAAGGESFGSPALLALRQACVLLPTAQRMNLRSGWDEDSSHSQAPVAKALAHLLLCAHTGDRAGAAGAIEGLVRLRPLLAAEDDDADGNTRLRSGARYWGFILGTGIHLQEWQLLPLAAELWERALADPALTWLEGPQALETAGEVRARLFAAKLALGESADLDRLLAEYRRGPQTLQGVSEVAEMLESMGAWPRALQVYRRLWEEEPGSLSALRSVLSLCAKLNDTETTAAVLERAVTEHLFVANDNMQRDLMLQYSGVLEHRPDLPAARALLAAALETSPYDTRLLNRLAALQEASGQTAEAEETWRRIVSIEPLHSEGRLKLATFLEKKGDFAGAAALLSQGSRAGTEMESAEALFTAGQTAQALDLVEKLNGPVLARAASGLAGRMAESGDLRSARRLLQQAIQHSSEPAAAMALQKQLLETWLEAPEPTAIHREFLRLRRLAGDDPALLGIYFGFANLRSADLGIDAAVQAELEAAWAEGAGLLQAGMVLVSREIDRQSPRVPRTLEQLLARRDLAPLLPDLASALRAGHRPELAARVQERLVSQAPFDDAPVLDLIGDLRQAGQHRAAVAALEKWGARAPLTLEFASAVARSWVELGEPNRAEPLYAQLTAPGSILSTSEPLLGYARLLLAEGRARDAGPLLRRAAAYPGPATAPVLANWLRATGQAEHIEEALRDFDLTPAQWASIRSELKLPPRAENP